MLDERHFYKSKFCKMRHESAPQDLMHIGMKGGSSLEQKHAD